MLIRSRLAWVALVGLVLCGMTARGAADPSASLKKGTPDLKSAGSLAFGPDGILFIGDTQGAAVFAIDTGDRARVANKASIKVEGLNEKIAQALGTTSQQVTVNDVAVNPTSGRVYLSVSRGRGPEAKPVLFRVGPDGKLEEVSLENVAFAKADVPNAPAPGAAPPSARPGAKKKGNQMSPRSQSITDLAYVDGRLFLAGLSNEEFSSRLLAIPFPFTEAPDGASVEIYHGSHGQFETRSPIRTFAAYKINGEPYLLAAYTCTPLVKVPVADLKAGAHVKGKTIAELGNHNVPLDMVVYTKDGKDYILMANNSRGVMKIPTEGADTATPITQRVPDTQGLSYEKIEKLKGVLQLDQLDKDSAVVIIDNGGVLILDTIDLP
jgi:hypothetical protein